MPMSYLSNPNSFISSLRKLTSKSLLFLGLSVALFACQRHTHIVKTDTAYLPMGDQKQEDSTIVATISPYKQKMEQEMNTVIGTNSKLLELFKPESPLGNWAADLVYEKTSEYLGFMEIDFALLNYGGLRIPSLPAGDITKSKVFELMPFDNVLVVVEIKGSELQLLFDRAAQDGGWPVSKHVKMTMRGGKAQDVRINDQKVLSDKIYKVATNDYLANGGDQCTFLKDNTVTSSNKLFRNAILEYIVTKTAAGESLQAKVENRVFILK